MPYQLCDKQLLIAGIRGKFRTVIEPDLTSPDAKMAAVMIQGLLGHLQFMLEGFDAAMAGHESANAQIPIPPAGAGASAPLHTVGIVAGMARVFDQPVKAQLTAAGSVVANFEEFHRQRRSFEQSAEFHLDEIETQQPNIAQSFHGYLTRRFGRPFQSFVNVRRIPGGFSKETYIIELHAGDELDGLTKIVLRMDSPGLPTGASVMDEFPLLGLFRSAGVPMARPLWCEQDAAQIGAAFQVSAFVDGLAAGSSDEAVTSWGDDPNVRRDLGNQVARILATLHAIPPEGGPYQSADIAVKSLDYWQAFDRQYRAGTEPTVDLLYSWLRANVPRSGDRVSWLHGDFGPYNMLIKDGRVRAVLDWELAHLGDPMEDLAYCRPFFQSLLPWDEFLSTYVEAGGVPFDPVRAKFYDVFRSVGILAKTAKFRYLFNSGINKDIKLLFPSIDRDRHFIQEALEVVKPELSGC